MLRLGDEIGGAEGRVGRVVSDDYGLGGTVDRVDTDIAEDSPFRESQRWKPSRPHAAPMELG